MTLPARALGGSGLEITAIGSGSWVMGGGDTDGQALEEPMLGPWLDPQSPRHFLDVCRSSRLGSSFTVFSQREQLLSG